MNIHDKRTRTVAGALCIAVLGAIAMLPRALASEEEQAEQDTAKTESENTELVARGKRLYIFCQACHATEESADHKIGPHLADIIDRPVASVEDSTYSAALQEQDFVWNEENLDLWIKQPSALVPGTNMSFVGIPGAELRSALIAYLKTL